MQMIYLSKGILPWKSNMAELSVSHCGKLHKLTGTQAELWLAGQHKPEYTVNTEQEDALKVLINLGIAENGDSSDETAVFRLLTNCAICPVRVKKPIVMLNRLERRIWRWITQAGLHLTMAELTRLSERGTKPIRTLVGEANRQVLTEEIYNSETIFDGILETLMEKSPARDETVRAVLGLLRKKQIYLV